MIIIQLKHNSANIAKIRAEDRKGTVLFKWLRPEPGEVKLNFDGGLNDNRARRGFLVRHEYDVTIVAGCSVVMDRNVLLA